MKQSRFSIRISFLFPIIILIAFIITVGYATAIANYVTKQLALQEAETKMRLILDRNLSLHTYFTRDLKPALFEWSEPFRTADYFDPTWMSSTYALRTIGKYFSEASATEYYYKDAAINARSPENEADAAERAYLEALNRDPTLAGFSEVQTIDGQPHLVVMRPGEILETSCLRCHGDPADAPQGLVAIYGAERSFHREADLGKYVTVLSVRVPLSAAYATASQRNGELAGFLLLLLTIVFVVWYWFQRRLLLEPLSKLHAKAVQISGSAEHLGEEIPGAFSKELDELTRAFNVMSRSLRAQVDLQEQRIQERTAELRAANQQLAHEVLERQRAEEALRDISFTDALTGLYNRRGFLLFAEQQLTLAHRLGRGALLIYGDMNNLKVINDTLGHAQGDQALIDVATILKDSFRESDAIARLGGDEFVVLALDAPPDSAEALLARARQWIEALNAQPGRSYQISLSLGVARYDPAAPRSLDELLARADRRMYRQKQSGGRTEIDDLGGPHEPVV